MMKKTGFSITLLAALLLSSPGRSALAQAPDSAGVPTTVRAAVNVTSKGISTVPSLTLGKPAAIFDVAISRKDLSFEPQFRFGLDGKPWSFLFWWRYRLMEGEKLRLTVGAHPALSFRTVPGASGASPDETIVVRRYLATEVSPTYIVSPNLSVGAYHLYSYGIDRVVTRHTNMVALRSTLSATVADDYTVRLAPQVYYLRMDDRDGYYLYSGFTVGKRGVPVSISAVVNRTIQTDIVGGEDLLWNVSLNTPLH